MASYRWLDKENKMGGILPEEGASWMKPKIRWPIGSVVFWEHVGHAGGLYPVGGRDKRAMERCQVVGGKETSQK